MSKNREIVNTIYKVHTDFPTKRKKVFSQQQKRALTSLTCKVLLQINKKINQIFRNRERLRKGSSEKKKTLMIFKQLKKLLTSLMAK